jgi:hypothetical protein
MSTRGVKRGNIDNENTNENENNNANSMQFQIELTTSLVQISCTTIIRVLDLDKTRNSETDKSV